MEKIVPGVKWEGTAVHQHAGGDSALVLCVVVVVRDQAGQQPERFQAVQSRAPHEIEIGTVGRVVLPRLGHCRVREQMIGSSEEGTVGILWHKTYGAVMLLPIFDFNLLYVVMVVQIQILLRFFPMGTASFLYDSNKRPSVDRRYTLYCQLLLI